MSAPAMNLVPGMRLAHPHPYAGRDAYQCPSCKGFLYPPQSDGGPPPTCPYCEEDDD